MAEEKVISVRLKKELFEKVKFVSNKIRRSNNWVIREVLENYLEDLYDFEEAKGILLDKTDKIVSHEQAKREILSD
jgi:predicted DNA-binding protein